MSEPKEIFVRVDRCLGCHSCEVACAVEHSRSKKLFAAMAESPTPRHRLWVEYASPSHKVPVVCRHCEEAPCMHACISGAIRRAGDGAVLTDEDRCIGCWTCVMVCPYGVIGRHLETRKSYRCDRCQERESPACVSACPTHALEFRTVREFSAGMRQDAAAGMLAEGKG